ncbi:VOC family protein [Mangrovicella endophytica]|uniref:VOC family protein n=1 Tax=Mangrovicella endophytica TaxID=2066697 RepID=UPI000C9E5FBC|nr:glyoxalase/bleomycin resistance/extradiol dioxygenase family protein [Mangrovicella endophytica]
MPTDAAADPANPTPKTRPRVLGGVAPYLNVEGALAAAALYGRAFGAETVFTYPPDDKGRSMHIHLVINGGSVMLSDFYPEYGHNPVPPQAITLHMQLEEVDVWWDRAVAAGLTVVTPLQPMFWGERYGVLRDPYGVSWSMGGPLELPAG